MPRDLTVPGRLLQFRADKALSPGMHAVVLRLGHEVDRAGFHGPVTDAVWFSIPAVELRGERSDNQYLREWLRRLMRVELGGDYRGDPWGAVLVSEFHIEDGGSRVRVLMPPAAINALRAPETFAKVEMEAAHRLYGSARTLYLLLADKKRLNRDWWEFELPELRQLLGADHKSYQKFNRFRERVLDPAVGRVNAYGTVAVEMTPIRSGRVVWSVRFNWRWKSLDEVREASEENDRHSAARRKRRDSPREAPPLTVARVEDAQELPPRPETREERAAVLDRTGAASFVRLAR